MLNMKYILRVLPVVTSTRVVTDVMASNIERQLSMQRERKSANKKVTCLKRDIQYRLSRAAKIENTVARR